MSNYCMFFLFLFLFIFHNHEVACVKFIMGKRMRAWTYGWHGDVYLKIAVTN